MKSATLLADNSSLKFTKKGNRVIIEVPEKAPDQAASVIKLQLVKKLPPVKTISNLQKYLNSLGTTSTHK